MILTAGGPLLAADQLPPRKEILALMKKVNAWQVSNPSMRAGDRNWERGTWYTGVMAARKATRDPVFLKQAMDWGTEHGWQVGTEKANGANRLFCAETWLELFFIKEDRAMIEPTIQWLATDAPNSPGGAKRWYLEGYDHAYVDSLYGAPALAMLAKATGDRKYLSIMHAFFDDVTGELLDKSTGLYYRDKRFLTEKTPNGKKVLWSRGNGWVFAGIARILEYLPQDNPKRQEYIGIFRRMAIELVKRQSNDGFWRANLDDPQVLPEPETSGTGFFCFGLAWGVDHGILSRSEFLPSIQKAWSALSASVTPEGKVQWGQQVDSQPNRVQRDSTHEYVTGAVLLAGSEVWRLAGSRH